MHDAPAGKAGNHRGLRRGRRSLPQHVYHVTAATQARQPFFDHPDAAQSAARCFIEPTVLGDAVLLAWVLMPDHVHWLLQLGSRDTLATVVNRLKSAPARKANEALHRQGPIWKAAYYDRALRSDEATVDVARYIIGNPVRAGLVERVGDYPYWNAIWLNL